MDPTNTPTDVPPVQATPAPPAAPDSGTTPGSNLSAEEAQRVQRAALGAVEQHVAESRRSRGQRGPDKKPRAPRRPAVPLDPVGNGAGQAPLAEDPPQPLEVDWETEPAFDEKLALEMVQIAVGLLNDGCSAIVRAVAKNETGDEVLAEEAAKSVRMTEKIESAVTKGAVLCAKKYSVRLDYAPEIMFGGGLVVHLGQAAMVVRQLKATGRELRAGRGAAPATN
jgi:hypothetical protein